MLKKLLVTILMSLTIGSPAFAFIDVAPTEETSRTTCSGARVGMNAKDSDAGFGMEVSLCRAGRQPTLSDRIRLRAYLKQAIDLIETRINE